MNKIHINLLRGSEHARNGALATLRANPPDDDDARHLSSRPPIDRPTQTKASKLLSSAVLGFANIAHIKHEADKACHDLGEPTDFAASPHDHRHIGLQLESVA